MGKVIDKQAFFVVHMARTLETKGSKHKTEVLEQIHPKARALVNRAFVALAKQRIIK